jgi:hypothetical protein
VRRLADVFCERIEDARDGNMDETRKRLDDFIDDWISQAKLHGPKLRFQSPGKQHPGLIKPFKNPGTGIETLQSLRNVDVPLKLDVPVNESAGA